MIIIPAIDLIDGKCVRLLQGDYSKKTVYGDDPVVVAKLWKKQGAKRIHIVDLDGAKAGAPVNTEVIKRIAQEVGVELQVGGGVRSIDSIKHLIKSGPDRVILGTVALENLSLLKQFVNLYGGKIIVSLDVRNGTLMKKGWLEQSDGDLSSTISQLESAGVQTIIYTDTSRDGTLEGPNFKEIEKVKKQTTCELIIAGGLSSIDDIKKLKELNIDGVILGKSLYEKKIDLKEAIDYVS